MTEDIKSVFGGPSADIQVWMTPARYKHARTWFSLDFELDWSSFESRGGSSDIWPSDSQQHGAEVARGAHNPELSNEGVHLQFSTLVIHPAVKVNAFRCSDLKLISEAFVHSAHKRLGLAFIICAPAKINHLSARRLLRGAYSLDDDIGGVVRCRPLVISVAYDDVAASQTTLPAEIVQKKYTAGRRPLLQVLFINCLQDADATYSHYMVTN
ncbi:hypothetical protein BJ165DRAFT_1408237 [Panaeolus papilionaceus]|nr:hypothetical protein BJ165DRAFT_1408237 [Panaeolus papilionaceus]